MTVSRMLLQPCSLSIMHCTTVFLQKCKRQRSRCATCLWLSLTGLKPEGAIFHMRGESLCCAVHLVRAHCSAKNMAHGKIFSCSKTGCAARQSSFRVGLGGVYQQPDITCKCQCYRSWVLILVSMLYTLSLRHSHNCVSCCCQRTPEV